MARCMALLSGSPGPKFFRSSSCAATLDSNFKVLANVTGVKSAVAEQREALQQYRFVQNKWAKRDDRSPDVSVLPVRGEALDRYNAE